MAKRFTDTFKWKSPFFKNLDNKYKLLWLFMLDDCDTCGVWTVDFDLVEMRLKEEFDLHEVTMLLADKIKVIDKEHWFIPEFLSIQYRNAKSTDSKFHQSIQKRLREYGLTGYTDYDPELPYEDDRVSTGCQQGIDTP